MKNSILFRISRLFFLFTFLSFFSLTAQNDKAKNIVEHYQNYAEDAREVVYLHLNKSTYIKGEAIGFTAYVIDKKDKKSSKVTTNLYVSIEDENKNVLKQKLVKVEDGITSNSFKIDEDFGSGYYTIKAYTNWMRNFNEQNYFVESLKIVDPKKEKAIITEAVKNSIDAQFLPEGGHLLNGVVNNVGVILKDYKGYGVPSVKGRVMDQDNNLVTEFEVNELGIGKFPLLAELDKSYKVNLSYLNKDYSFDFNAKVEPVGVTLSLVKHRNKAIVALMTNKESLNYVKGKPYQMTIHNGDNIDVTEVVFNDDLTIMKAFELDNIASGVNILTLFNEKNEPIIERLFFNYNGINIIGSDKLSAVKTHDSITMKLNFKDIDPSVVNNMSISVLPQETESYKRHHNILSYTYLQPYVNGVIENAKYYFTDITEEKKVELDNLLVTQGWSSYDWNTIFNESVLMYPFEQGITLRANINAESRAAADTYMVHAMSNDRDAQFFDVDNTNKDKSFVVENIFVNEDDKVHLSKLNNRNELEPARLYLQSFPNKIPSFQTNDNFIKPKWDYKTFAGLKNVASSFLNLNEVQQLDEVVVETKAGRKELKTRELSKGRSGRVHVVDEDDVIQFQSIADFLVFRAGLTKKTVNGTTIVTTFSGGVPTLFLDDMRVMDRTILDQLPLLYVNFVEVDRRNISRTSNSDGGIVKIYTDFKNRPSNNVKTTQDYKLPLAFSAKKKFYVPNYGYHNDDFFKGYGTIDWKPELSIDNIGNVTVKIKQPEVPITLFIEGIANDGSFIFEEKSVSLN